MDIKSFKGIGEVTVLQYGSSAAVIDSFGAKCLALVIDDENLLFYDEEDIGHSGSPLCFPSFGPLKNNEFLFDGKAYPMKQHGFVRDNECTKVSSTESEATYELKQNEDSLKRFPFNFTFTVTYTLSENDLKINTKMTNQSNQPMPVLPGIHPYFALENPDNVQFTTKASQAYNNLNKYEAESLDESDYLKIIAEKDGIKTVKVCRNPDHHMPNHGLETMEILRGNQKSIKLKTDFASFKLMTVWRKSADSKFICLEPANIQNGLNTSPIIINTGESMNSVIAISV
ncbi:MAG: hypothetical protein NE327_15970 [Lentisphaeraceae bacterium]|nr:hypothetical protein [Lentisphaeraceae bacterium]